MKSIKILNVELPIRQDTPNKLKHLVPDKRSYILKQPNLDAVLYSIKETTDNILLVGEPGTGKSEFVLYLAAELNQPVVQIQGDGELTVVDLIGNLLLRDNKFDWQDGPLTYAVRNGCWILIDEINLALPEIYGRLYSLLDDRRFLDLRECNDILKLNKNTRIFATMNPSHDGRHIGTKPLAPALESRFHLTVPFNYLEAKDETELLMSKAPGLTTKQAEQIQKYAQKVRQAYISCELNKPIDPRTLIKWAQYTVGLKDIKKAAEVTMLNKFQDQDMIKKATELLKSYGIID